MGIVKVLRSFNHSLAMVSGKENRFDKTPVLCRQVNPDGAPVSPINPTNSELWCQQKPSHRDLEVGNTRALCFSLLDISRVVSFSAEASQVMGPLQFLFQGYCSRTIIKSLAFKHICR